MHIVHRLVNHVGSAAEKIVYDVVDGLFVAGNGRGREHHHVVGAYGHLVEIASAHAVERTAGLTLRTRGDDDHLFGRQFAGSVGNYSFRYLQLAHTRGDVHYAFHASARQHDLSAVLLRKPQYLLNAVVGRGETSNDDAFVGVGHENVFQPLPHHHFGSGRTLPLHVGGFAEHEHDALCADFRNALQVGLLAVDGSVVDFEVARYENNSEGRGDGERAGSRHGVRHFDKLHLETPQAYTIALFYLDEFGFESSVAQLAFQHAESESRTVNGNAQFVRIIRNGSYMVLVTVRQHDAANLVDIFFDIRDVGENCVDAGTVLARKFHAAIHDDNVVAEFEGCHVFSYFAHAAQKNHSDGFCHIAPLREPLSRGICFGFLKLAYIIINFTGIINSITPSKNVPVKLMFYRVFLVDFLYIDEVLDI